MTHGKPLVLFDIDGTLIRRAGPHHRQALVDAVRRTTGLETTTDGVPVAGMLDRDILTTMLSRSGMRSTTIREVMPDIVRRAQWLYSRTCPDLQRKVCPGVRALLSRLERSGVVTGLVTGNLTRIAWKKMDHAGLRPYFRFGAFAEQARDRSGLARMAIREARREKWIGPDSPITLIGDHPNDVKAAQANGVQSIAVATGVISLEELQSHSPDIALADLRAIRLDMLL
ncbi:MAG: HAD hydrolase-like protein [Acidobacteriota bacterium]|nr:HAD hydrolase-like protein [Acidobacteriota bacterium]